MFSIYQRVFENTSEGILVFGRDGEILRANKTACSIFACEQGNFLDRSVEDIVAIEQKEILRRELLKFSGRKELPEVLSVIRKDGKLVRLKATIDFLEELEPPRALLFLVDVTESLESEEKLQISEKKFNAMARNAVDGIIIISDRGLIEFFNSSAERLFKYDQSEVLGRNISILADSPHSQRHDEYLSRYLTTGKKKIIGLGREVVGKRKDGSTFPFWLSVSEIRLDDRVIFTGTVHDLTEIKKAEFKLRNYSEELEERVRERTLALKESQLLYQSIANKFPRGIISVIDHDYNFLFADGERLGHLGLVGKHLVGNSVSNVYEKTTVDFFRSKLEPVFKGEVREFDFEEKGRVLKVDAVPLGNAEGQFNRILLVEHDISEISMALKKEQELNELKTGFVSMASHEFRTPLSTIMSSATLISKYADTSHQGNRMKHVNRIQKNVRGLTDILNDFLSLGKLDEKLTVHEPEPFMLQPFIEEFADETRQNLKEGQYLRVNYVGGKKEITLDHRLLKNVLRNLLSNASKYSERDQKIELNIENQGKKLHIEVVDEGIGIPEEEQERLFSRFFRARNSRDIPGTGLGLNIVSKYLDLMGGTISLNSREGKGTKALISFDL